MLGWLVVIPRRHVEGPHELNAVEAAALGPLLQQASQALVNVLGCSKTYVIMFAETPGFTHLHFHVVPRDAQLPTRLRGTNVFEFMRKPEADWVPLEQQRELVLRLRAASGDRGQ
jgi:diadenosine tetraphosphate (Ap4A) HIT family hydrolase